MPMNGNKPTEQQALQERQKFVTAFNDTMLRIWQEQITLLGVIDTGALLASPKALPLRADGRFFEVGLSQSFLEICDLVSAMSSLFEHCRARADYSIRPVAGLWHGPRDAPWQQRRSWPSQETPAPPLVLSQVLRLSYATEGILRG